MTTPSAQDFRNCLSNIATPVVVATVRMEENPYGITIGSFTSVSLDPLLVSFCLGKNSSIFTHFTTSKAFAINFLTIYQAEVSQQFAKPMQLEWSKISYHFSEQLGLPVLNNIYGYLECEQYAIYEGGDHVIILGKVLNLKVHNNHNPLLYYNRNYTTITR
jgi:3-hydroxy-9,10-secoandrosta-1,3,5(10)-triene-9,17-dione monooxygenase reductase component